MQQSGEYWIGAPIGSVWKALNDPDVLGRCIEGCQSLEKMADDAFKATVKARIGPVSAVFVGDVTLADHVRQAGETPQARSGPSRVQRLVGEPGRLDQARRLASDVLAVSGRSLGA